MADTTKGFNFSKILKSPDLAVAIFMIVIVMMFIIPLPAFLLDLFMVLSISISLLVLLLVIFSKDPLELSIFPSLILVLTLFRLGINVSSTRLILRDGQQFQGALVRAFGNFVVGGEFVIGIIIFIIIIAVQYLVISKGTTRVSEVAARFALDSLPGKQMAIDSDLAAGMINEQDAVKKRLDLQREVDFYGDMDGATKYVSGDIIVGIIITLINAIGGVLIGSISRGMSAGEAFNTFILLTVGDGLISQIPSILNAVAAGMIVTRSVANDTLGVDIKEQIRKQYKPLWIVAITIALLGFIPGFPTFICLLLSGIFGSGAYFLGKEERAIEEQEKVEAQAPEEEEKRPVDKLVPIDPIAIEFGYSLIPLVDKSQGGDLFDRIRNVREQIALDYGMIVPTIVVRDSLKLEPNEYSIKINGVSVASWGLNPDKLLAINPGMVSEEIDGIGVEEPSYNLPAKWINIDDKDKAESFGYTVIDASTVLVTHLTETLIKNVDELLGREDVKKILDSVKDQYPTLVSEVQGMVNYGFIQKVLQLLLKDKVTIRNIATILETISDYAKDVTNPEVIVEYVRQSLKNQICKQYLDDKGFLNSYTINQQLENFLADEFEKVERTGVTSINPEFLNQLVNSLTEKEKEAYNNGYEYFIVLTSTRLRRHLNNLMRNIVPKAIFLSYDEVSQYAKVDYIGEINIQNNQK